MFVSPEMSRLLLSGKHVRCLQTPTASFMCVSGQTHASPCVCSLVINDFEFCHSPASGDAGGLRRTADLGGGGILQRMNGNGQVYAECVCISVLQWRFTTELGGCFVFWKKMVSWLFWPIKAVLWLWPLGTSAYCRIICCFLLPLLGTCSGIPAFQFILQLSLDNNGVPPLGCSSVAHF